MQYIESLFVLSDTERETLALWGAHLSHLHIHVSPCTKWQAYNKPFAIVTEDKYHYIRDNEKPCGHQNDGWAYVYVWYMS
jgi:hypothetical protein